MYCMTELIYLNKIDQIKSFKHLIKLYLNLIQKLYIYMNNPKLYIHIYKFKIYKLK